MQLRRAELDFFYQGPGTSFYFPDFWEEYVGVIPEAERGDLIKAYQSVESIRTVHDESCSPSHPH